MEVAPDTDFNMKALNKALLPAAFTPLVSHQGSFHSVAGIVVHRAAPWDSSGDSWQRSKLFSPGDAKSKEQPTEVSYSPAWAGRLPLTTGKVAMPYDADNKGPDKTGRKQSIILFQYL